MDELLEQNVNYVWINEFPCASEGALNDSLCKVPMHYLDKALHNAKRYSAATFNIWLDKSKLDPMSVFWVKTYIAMRGCDNVTIRDLNDISAFQNEDRFGNDHYYDLWARLDYARLLVLEHILCEQPWVQAFYSDFDANDVDIQKAHIQKPLEEWGMVIGTTECNGYENSFFGFNEKGMGLLSKLLVETAVSFDKMDDGYGALARFLRNENFIDGFFCREGCSVAKKEMPVSLIGKVKPKKLHQKLGLC